MTTAHAPAANSQNTVGYVALVRGNRNFRYLWIGQIISLTGDWFDLIAAATLASRLTHSQLAVGGLFVVRMLAPFFISPFAGVWADRYNRKWLLIACDASRAIVVLGFLLVRDERQAWLLFAVTAVQLAISGVYFPTRTAILPDVVSRGELGAANALSAGTWSVMLAFGAALGGLSAGRLGIYPSFVIDSLTFVVSAACVYVMAYQGPAAPTQRHAGAGGAWANYADGLRYLARQPDILMIALLKAWMSLSIAGALQVLQVELSEKVFVIGQGGGISLGLMYAAVGIGTGLGPIVARRITGDRDRPLRLAIVFSYAISVTGLLLILPLSSFNVVLLAMLLRGIGTGTNWVFSTQLLFMLTPDRVRGRVFATEFALMTLASAVSAAGGGWLLDHGGFGIGGVVWVMTGLTVLSGALWGVWLIFGKRIQPAADELAPEVVEAD